MRKEEKKRKEVDKVQTEARNEWQRLRHEGSSFYEEFNRLTMGIDE